MRERCAHDKADVSAPVPGVGHPRNSQVQRLTIDIQLLNVTRPRIRRMAQEEHAFVRPSGEAFHAVMAQEGACRNAIRLQQVKAGLCVSVRGGGYVSPFDVQDDGQLFGVRMTDGLLQDLPPLGAPCFIKSGVRFDRARHTGNGINNLAVGGEDIRDGRLERRVQANAQERIVAARDIIQEREEALRAHAVDSRQDTDTGLLVQVQAARVL